MNEVKHVPGSNINSGKSARQKGARRKGRRHRAERREATAPIRELINEQRRAEGHPGWVERATTRRWW